MKKSNIITIIIAIVALAIAVSVKVDVKQKNNEIESRLDTIADRENLLIIKSDIILENQEIILQKLQENHVEEQGTLNTISNAFSKFADDVKNWFTK